MVFLPDNARPFVRKSMFACTKFFPINQSDVSYIVEPKNWAIKSEGINIVRHARLIKPGIKLGITSRPYLTNSKILHFGSQFMFQNWLKYVPINSKIVTTYFHGKMGFSKGIDDNLNFLVENQNRISRVIVSCTEMYYRLQEYGIKPNLLIKIPIGISTNTFKPISDLYEKSRIKAKYGIPKDILLVGSFQKDGIGWRRGNIPKLIKGPDILVESLKEISNKRRICVLLTGPSRGYVINSLRNLGIEFWHLEPKTEFEMAEIYRTLDLYLITSRDEGGPKGLIESLSSGCPVVTTPVGLAKDIDLKSKHFVVTKTFKPSEIARESIAILDGIVSSDDKKLLQKSVKFCEWEKVADLHVNHVYNPILNGYCP